MTYQPEIAPGPSTYKQSVRQGGRVKTDRNQRYERWKTAVQWAGIALVWIAMAYVTPDIPLLTYRSENLYVGHLVFVLSMGMFGYAYELYSQWRETPDAPGPDDLQAWNSEE